MPTYELIQSVLASTALIAAIAGIAWKPVIAPIYERLVARKFEALATVERQELLKDFESYKQRLLLEAESIRADNQRRLHDFGLFATKRHEVYAKLYFRIVKATDFVANLHHQPSLVTGHTASLGDEELELMMSELGIGKATQLAITELWESDQEESLNRLSVVVERRRKFRARSAISRAVSYHLANELYLSPAVRETVQKILTTTSGLYHHIIDHDASAIPEMLGAVNSLRGSIYAEMTEEIRAGDYSK